MKKESIRPELLTAADISLLESFTELMIKQCNALIEIRRIRGLDNRSPRTLSY